MIVRRTTGLGTFAVDPGVVAGAVYDSGIVGHMWKATDRYSGETDNEYAARMAALSQQTTVSQYKSATMWLGVALAVVVAGAFFLKR